MNPGVTFMMPPELNLSDLNVPSALSDLMVSYTTKFTTLTASLCLCSGSQALVVHYDTTLPPGGLEEEAPHSAGVP